MDFLAAIKVPLNDEILTVEIDLKYFSKFNFIYRQNQESDFKI